MKGKLEADVRAALADGGQDEGIRGVYRVVFQRTPSAVEMEKARRFLQLESERQQTVEKQQAAGLAKARKRAEEVLQEEQSKTGVAARASVLNTGDLEARAPLTPWETFVQALLLCNEAAYLN